MTGNSGAVTTVVVVFEDHIQHHRNHHKEVETGATAYVTSCPNITNLNKIKGYEIIKSHLLKLLSCGKI